MPYVHCKQHPRELSTAPKRKARFSTTLALGTSKRHLNSLNQVTQMFFPRIKMAQKANVLVTKADALSSIPGAYGVGEYVNPCKLSSDLGAHMHTK